MKWLLTKEEAKKNGLRNIFRWLPMTMLALFILIFISLPIGIIIGSIKGIIEMYSDFWSSVINSLNMFEIKKYKK